MTKQTDDFADKSSLSVDFPCCVMRCTNVTPDDERGTGEISSAKTASITDEQNEYVENLAKQLRESGIRAHADLSAQRMNANIRQAQLMKVPYMIVVGDNEMQAGQVSLRARDGSQQNNIPLGEFIARAKDKIARRANEL